MNLVGTIVAVYAAIVLLFSLPFMQKALANWTAHILSNQLKSKVEIGSINLGLLNRIIVNDLTIYEPSGERMANIARVSASLDFFSILSGRINIGTAQLFGTEATLYKQTSDSEPNYQFLVDAFTSDEKDEPTTIDLRLGSFIMRHANITYDVLSEPTHSGKFDVNHLHLHEGGMNIALRHFTNDSLNLTVRRLQAKELNSGLAIHNTQLRLTANQQSAMLTNFSISLPHSYIAVDSLYAQYGNYKAEKEFEIYSTPITGTFLPYDLAPLYGQLAPFTDPINFHLTVEGNEEKISLHNIKLSSNQHLELHAAIEAEQVLDKEHRVFHADIQTLHITSNEILQIANALAPEHGKENLIETIHELTYTGQAHYTAEGGTLASQGNLMTSVGDVQYDITYDATHWLEGTVSGDSIHLGKVLNDEKLGTTSFNINLAMNLSDMKPFSTGKASGAVHNIYYNNYNYQNIAFDTHSTTSQIQGVASIDDESAKAHAEFAYSDAPTKDIQLQLILEKLYLNRLNIIEKHEEERVSLIAKANLHGSDFQHLYGSASIDSLRITTPTEHYHLNDISFHAERHEEGNSSYRINSDFLSANIQGEISLSDLASSMTYQLSRHLPALIKPVAEPMAEYRYDITMKDLPILHHLTDTDFEIPKPIHIFGNVSSANQQMALQLSAPCLMYNGKQYDDIAVSCNTTTQSMNVHAWASTFQDSDDDDVPPSSTQLDITADVHNNRINTDLKMNIEGRNNIAFQLLPIVQFKDSLGSLKTDINLRKSTAVINDTAWTVSPSRISLYKQNIACHHVKFANNNTNSFLEIDGRASSSPKDSLVATLNNLEIKYILSLVDFDAVRFAGRASGKAVVNNVLGEGVPDVRAKLFVENLSVQEGAIGDANIQAHWDKKVDGIAVEGHIIDLYTVPDGLSGEEKNMTGITTVNGWISPAKNDIQLNINTHNTNAAFIHGFLGGVFKEVTGYVTGALSIIGPLNNVNIVGDAVPNMNLRLRATNVPYHIEGDTLHLRPYLFDFKDISIYDRFGHRSVINGQVTHRNMKNFAYHFQADLHELLAYDETEFNSDKFLATVFADGDLTIDGSDGHPLYVDASITPTKGSVFAYDAATPDAITGNTFIEFRDRDSLLTFAPKPVETNNEPVEKDSLTIVKEAKKNYDSDIFINFDINLTPACEVKLRMDNIENGYMSTFGNAQLTAKWYNKGSFQLFGNYNIESGSYRLYLQDIIFRDLALQSGSMVEFNGNPFDANIHLICHHTINAVPLSDLTATTAFSQNNKVKVICILDITGKLGNMDFAFDMDIPNVNEEVRQLVRSMINSEEEMNTQMIYLLGLGRFYPNEYARANGGNNSGQAVNSLLSSTLSGQINQMLSNVIGNNTNWNFGSSLTTGERGWEDLDVEGLLSGHLLDDRLLINGAFGYRDNAMTNQGNFIGDFEVKWRMNQKGTLYVKAYNQTNDRYFTKATLNTQGIGLSWTHDFEVIRQRMRKKRDK